ncbi:putative Pisatin demethylase [Hyaloscypha sp. PMI_1271]|nr:putative Pisatin demethylase [Hyaloscypha sp. PMI_1271]
MDMLGSFMRHGMKEVNAITETILQIIAGSDTSATVIRATMLFIMTSPRVYHRLQTEIDNHVKTTNLPSTQIISYKTAEVLPYLQAVIREGMRIWVPAVGIIPKTTPPEGDTLNGIFVPGGTDIGCCFWGIARNTDVFGDDSEIFRPERWLEARGEKLAKMERTIDLLFGYGKDQCLGQTIAWMELNKVFFELVRNFEWSIVDPKRPWKSDCVALWLQKDLWVRVSERECNHHLKY